MSSRARWRFRRSQRSSYSGIHQLSLCDTERTNLNPQCSSFSDSGELRRLVVREAERRYVLILTSEVGEPQNNHGDFGDKEREGLANEYQICVAENWGCEWSCA